ncbi:MAG TPA: NUDIX domain-containing protein [Acholeplasmataceae bacterium]|nr:NUDIX domain-containing protein [Acholeplasmataceae bacterium]
MRLLFKIDTKDYNINGKKFVRPSVRSIIIENGKVAMIHSLKYDYYKFPGGGIEDGESNEEALIRETLEESGLIIIPETIREYGYVRRIQKGKKEDVFLQDNFYYFCEVEPKIVEQTLDDYEADEQFTCEYVNPYVAININRNKDHGPKDPNMIERESRVLELLIKEGIIKLNL